MPTFATLSVSAVGVSLALVAVPADVDHRDAHGRGDGAADDEVVVKRCDAFPPWVVRQSTVPGCDRDTVTFVRSTLRHHEVAGAGEPAEAVQWARYEAGFVGHDAGQISSPMGTDGPVDEGSLGVRLAEIVEPLEVSAWVGRVRALVLAGTDGHPRRRVDFHPVDSVQFHRFFIPEWRDVGDWRQIDTVDALAVVGVVNEVVEGSSELQVQEAVVDVEMLKIGFDVLSVGVDGAEDGQPVYPLRGPVGSDARAPVESSYDGFVGK